MDRGADSYRRFLAGDDGGIAELVREYRDGLLLYLSGYVGFSAAEELTEETFFRLITRRPHFSGKSSFRSWLYAIGRHTAIDYLRHHAKTVDVPEGMLEACRSDEQTLEEAYLREEQKIRVHRALSRLLPDYRHVLWLVYFEDFSNGEAAAALKKNERQIRNLLYRAKQALRSELEREENLNEEL